MKLGHRGANHPVKNLIHDNVEITSQNHGFVVVEETLPKNIQITHKSLFDNSIEGIRLKTNQYSQYNIIQSQTLDHKTVFIYFKNLLTI